MTTYNTEEVKRYVHIYGKMVHLINLYTMGTSIPRAVENVRETIDEARRFPDELKDGCFDDILSGLERIAEGHHFTLFCSEFTN